MDKEHIDSHRLVQLCVYYRQTYLVNSLIQMQYVDWDQVINSGDPPYADVEEWWLVSPDLADELAEYGQTVLKDYNCSWWGRRRSDQEVYLDNPIVEVAKEYFKEPDVDPTRTGAKG